MNLFSFTVGRLGALHLFLIMMACIFWPSQDLMAQDTRPMPASSGFTIFSTQVFTPADGGETGVSGPHLRYQRSDGSWKDIKTYKNGKQIMLGVVGRGVFQVDEVKKQLVLLSALPRKEAATANSETSVVDQEDQLRKSNQFVREEIVSGYKTFVLRSPGSESAEYNEIYIAPALQGVILKQVRVSKDGKEVIEPTKIEVGEVAESIFTLPDYPINYTEFQKRIEENEPFRPEIAQRMREQLQELQRQYPLHAEQKKEGIPVGSGDSQNTVSTVGQPSKVIKVSGSVLHSMAIKRVQPPYPTAAKEARVSGSVQVEVVISEEGTVIEATVVNGPELLSDGALAAARMWVFKPTLLEGKPVKVQGILAFHFTLQ